MNQTTAASPTPEAIRAQLQQILQSPLFLNARRLSQFLQFVVVRSIEGRADDIKESLIGIEVYNRNPSFDPKADSIVRAEASRLRAKLREYYEGGGKHDPIRIELPKGSYSPVFRLQAGSVPEPAGLSEPAPKTKWRWRTATAATGILFAIAAALIFWPIRGARSVQSISVMPPVSLGSDQSNNALGETLADEITGALMDSGDWKVLGRAPSVDQTGRDQMLTWLRQNLHADFVLTGSYRVGGNSDVRLSLQVVNVEDGSLAWTQTYHQRLTYLADSKREFARSVVAAVADRARFSKHVSRRAANARAQKSYGEARELWSKYTDQGLVESVPLFRQSIQADPEFAPAWAGLADANMKLAERSIEPIAARIDEARNAARKAIALDDSNAEAHAALGWILGFQDWNFQEASRQLERAVALDPIRVFPNTDYSLVLTILGNFGDAQAELEAARARLPPIPEVLFQQGSVYFLARNFEKVEALGHELIALEPNGPLGHWLVGLALEHNGQVAKAIAEYKNGLQQQPKDLRTLCALSHAYGVSGDRARALETAGRFIDLNQKEITRWTLSCCAALMYAGMSEKDKAFEWLEKARAGHDASFPFFPHDFRFDSLKNDPRYAVLADSLKKAAGN